MRAVRTATARGSRPGARRRWAWAAAAAATVTVSTVAACTPAPGLGTASGGTGSSAGTGISRPATPAPSVSSPPPPFPEIGRVPQADGSTPLTSSHWVGYTFPTDGVTGVRAEWTEPSVRGRAGQEEFVWVGVGGWDDTDDNIVQDGTFVYYPPGGNGGKNEGLWYERVPPVNGEAKFPVGLVNPGDRIYASVTERGAGHWQVAVTDVTDGSSFSIGLRFHSMQAYPSFVVEDPDDGPAGPAGPFFPFPHWGAVTISNMQVRVNGSWVPAASLYGYRINMVRGGRVLASAGPLSSTSSFRAIQP